MEIEEAPILYKERTVYADDGTPSNSPIATTAATAIR
jgi:hypothetical protein